MELGIAAGIVAITIWQVLILVELRCINHSIKQLNANKNAGRSKNSRVNKK